MEWKAILEATVHPYRWNDHADDHDDHGDDHDDHDDGGIIEIGAKFEEKIIIDFF